MIKHIASEFIKLAASARTIIGSHRVRRLRQQGWLPCIVYDTRGQARPLQVNRHGFELLIRQHGSQNLVLDLDIATEGERKVLLKEIQRDHIGADALHADFQEISMTQKLRLAVTITLVGEPVGVSQQGGVLEHLLRAVEVECLPGDIVKTFMLDVSALNVGESLFVRDLQLDAKFTLLTPGDIALASVQLPAAEEEAAAEEAASAAEPEVIGAEKETEAAADSEAKEDKEKEPKAAGAKEKSPTAKEKGKDKSAKA